MMQLAFGVNEKITIKTIYPSQKQALTRVLNLANFNQHLFMHKSCSGFSQIVIPASAGIQQLALHGLWIPASQPE
jgi:hypothetical protein